MKLVHGIDLVLSQLICGLLPLKYILLNLRLQRRALFYASQDFKVNSVSKVEATFIFLVSFFFNFGNEIRKIHFSKGLLKKLLISRFKHVCGFIPDNTRPIDGVRCVGCVGLHATEQRLLRCEHNILRAHILRDHCVLTGFRRQL